MITQQLDFTGKVAATTQIKHEASYIALIERTVAEFGRIDMLINNAVGTRMGLLEEIPTRGCGRGTAFVPIALRQA